MPDKEEMVWWIIIIFLMFFLVGVALLCIFDREPYKYQCVSGHMETEQYTECFGNLYYKTCYPRKREYFVCDEYKKVKRK